MKAPAAERRVLILLAGAVWSIVGLWLITIAVRWLIPLPNDYLMLLPVASILVGLIIYYFGFSKLVAVNISRIYSQAQGKDKVCLFAFQNTKSYILIIVMIALGYILRHLPIPKCFIGSIYASIGLALFLASLIYYRSLRH